MSKLLLVLLLGVITIGLAQSQETDIKVIVNYLGVPRLFSQVISFSDLVYVPARELVEVLGATVVDEDPAAGTIIVRSGGSVLFMQVDIPEMLVNGQPIASPPLKRERGLLWAPVAALAQALGASSAWDAAAREVVVTRQRSQLLAVRSGEQVDHTRIVLDLNQNVEPIVGTEGPSRLVVTLPGTDVLSRPEVGGRVVSGVSVAALPDGSARVAVEAVGVTLDASTSSGFQVFSLPASDANPARIVINIGPAFGLAPREIAPRQVEQIIIDPGHGGPESLGARAPDGDFEKNIALDIARRLGQLLEQAGLEPVLTRTSDVAVSLAERSQIANANERAALFVSLHANSVLPGADRTAAQGVETWTFGQPTSPDVLALAFRENESVALTQEIQREVETILSRLRSDVKLEQSQRLANAVQASLVRTLGARDRGVRQNALAVLRNSFAPSILVEVGFLSHPEEGRRLEQDSSYRQRVAQALADGIAQYLNSR